MKEQTRLQLIQCLNETIEHLQQSEASVFSPLEPHEVISNLENSKLMLEGKKKFDRLLMEVEFAPTSTIQEISLANGWQREYLHISNRFDTLMNRYLKY